MSSNTFLPQSRKYSATAVASHAPCSRMRGGESAGAARISERHANVIVNTGGARASDVLHLMTKMRDAVREKFGVTLMPEVELLGLNWK